MTREFVFFVIFGSVMVAIGGATGFILGRTSTVGEPIILNTYPDNTAFINTIDSLQARALILENSLNKRRSVKVDSQLYMLLHVQNIYLRILTIHAKMEEERWMHIVDTDTGILER